jgi:hypothetical protein
MTIRRTLLCICLLAATITQAQTPTKTNRHPFVNYTELGLLAGRVAYSFNNGVTETVENRNSLTVQTFNGMQLTPRLAVGGVVGLDWYTAAQVLPLGAGLRLDLLPHAHHNVRLIGMADAGYGVTWLNRSSTGYVVSGGWMLNPGVGLRVGKPGGAAFLMSISYKRQAVSVQQPITGNFIRRDEERVYNRLAIRLGVSF